MMFLRLEDIMYSCVLLLKIPWNVKYYVKSEDFKDIWRFKFKERETWLEIEFLTLNSVNYVNDDI